MKLAWGLWGYKTVKGLLDSVDQRTKLAGHNRFEMLMFRLAGKQLFGINVFKVKEVIHSPKLTRVPNAMPSICGISNIRGQTIAIVDLSMAIGGPALKRTGDTFVIVTEYNRAMQGFMVGGVDRIVNLSWDKILPPPEGAAKSYMTAVTNIDEQLVEIIDVEKVLSEIHVIDTNISDEVMQEERGDTSAYHVLVADDSSVARAQIKGILDQLDIKSTIVKNGKAALVQLQEWAAEDPDKISSLLMLISDVEMPVMDGYSLTKAIRADANLAEVYVILHTSLSGVFNSSMVKTVGANEFIPKFKPDELGLGIINRIKEVSGH